jgi:hypothetical protein
VAETADEGGRQVTAGETKRQIEGLRNEVTEILNELQRRGRRTLSVGAMQQAATGQVRRTVQRNPAALALLGLSALLGVGALVVRARRRAREAQRPAAVLRRRAREAAEDLSDYWERARASMPVDVRFRAGGRRGARDEEDDGGELRIQPKEPSMLKKLMWMGLTSAMMALGGLLARRMAAAIWTRAMRETPPTDKV